MPKGYTHLTYGQRCHISAYLQSNFSQKEIAAKLKISPSTLSREIRKNRNKDGCYTAKTAQKRAKKRKAINASNPRKLTKKRVLYIAKKLELGWSPDQISGRLQLELRVKVSDSAIYDFIAKDRRQGGKLYLNLRRKGRKKRDYNRKRAGKSLIPSRVDISSRDPVVATKSRMGDWEADTVVGKGHKSGVITLVERYSKLVLIAKIDNFKSEHVAAQIAAMLRKYRHKLHTITFDNGLEFALHTDLIKHFPALKTYFAEPYKSWQRGLNEHTNGLIREYFPKGTDFSQIQDLDVMRIQNRLNFRPRAVLKYKTPEEVFFRAYARH